VVLDAYYLWIILFFIGIIISHFGGLHLEHVEFGRMLSTFMGFDWHNALLIDL
jgi:hypothetical protein